MLLLQFDPQVLPGTAEGGQVSLEVVRHHLGRFGGLTLGLTQGRNEFLQLADPGLLHQLRHAFDRFFTGNGFEQPTFFRGAQVFGFVIDLFEDVGHLPQIAVGIGGFDIELFKGLLRGFGWRSQAVHDGAERGTAHAAL
ncbi:hypothetical protein D3C84_777300 [compost metagenome]